MRTDAFAHCKLTLCQQSSIAKKVYYFSSYHSLILIYKLIYFSVTTLRKVLLSPEQASVNDLQDVLRWKNNLQIEEDELQDIRIPGSSLYIGESQGRSITIGTNPAHSLQYAGQIPQSVEPDITLGQPKLPRVNRRSTTLGVRPTLPSPGKHSPAVNRTTSLQYPQTPRHVPMRRSDMYIYGDSSDQESFYGPVAHSNNNERYVPLTLSSTPRRQELPESLRHIDMNAFKENIPQGYNQYDQHGHSQVPGQAPFYYIDQYGNPVAPQYASYIASQESLADSGVVLTQGSPNTSPSGFSPGFGYGGRINAKSMPNLLEEPNEDDNLILTKLNIENVMNSDLTSEEKLDVMAAMIEGNNDNEGKGIPLARLPTHVRNALKKTQPTENTVNVGDLRQHRRKQKHSVRPRSAMYYPQPPTYQNVKQTRRPHSTQGMDFHMQQDGIPSSIPSPIYRRPPDWQRDFTEAWTGQRTSYPFEMYDPSIRHPYPYHEQHPQLLRHKVPTDFNKIPQQREPPEIIPVIDASPGPLYNSIQPLPPVLIPVTDPGANPASHQRSTGPSPHRPHRDITIDSEPTTQTVETEEVLPQAANTRRKTSQLRASNLQTDSSRSYGIDIEQWVSQQQEVGVDHQGSLLESSDLEEIDNINDYVLSHAKPDRYVPVHF